MKTDSNPLQRMGGRKGDGEREKEREEGKERVRQRRGNEFEVREGVRGERRFYKMSLTIIVLE